MKSSTKDQVKGKLHEIKGKVKEKAGQVTNNPNLAAEGQNEKMVGVVRKKIGQTVLGVNDDRASLQLSAPGFFTLAGAIRRTGIGLPGQSRPRRRFRCLHPNPISDIRNNLRRHRTGAAEPQ